MQTGAWGSILTFEVSHEQLLTPNEIEVAGSARYSEQAVVATKPRYEFLGPGLATCTLQVRLATAQGMDPRTVIDTLRAAMQHGRSEVLVIGNCPVFDAGSRAVLESMTEQHRFHGRGGQLLAATVSLTFHEVAPRSLAVVTKQAVASTTVPKSGTTTKK